MIRKGIIGIDHEIPVPGGLSKRIIYADWTASGRNYAPIERRIQHELMPYVANTHTETSATGMAMTHAYHKAREIIKRHINAKDTDVLITAGAGMTRLVNKFQRMLGLRTYPSFSAQINDNDRPVVFITHMEHHSNQTSWLETIATVEIIQPTDDGLVDLQHFRTLIDKYSERKLKIASVTACSNVTGIVTPYQEMAKIIHEAGGYCFVDFACSAPYVDIDMHPEEPGAHLDAVLFSPHKFLGGPGSSAVLAFCSQLHKNPIPDNPGGGTVDWTNPWGEHKYVDNAEAREDGGTPAFLQTIKTAMCIKLKEEMGTANMQKREHHLLEIIWNKVEHLPNFHILAPQHKNRLAVLSFYIDQLHYNLGVRMLNDRFGIQSRGGCSCAGTYGHYLLNVTQEYSKMITDQINQGDISHKPGWIRISLHPTMTDEEAVAIGDALVELSSKFNEWKDEYICDAAFVHIKHRSESEQNNLKLAMENSFSASLLVSE